jgi:hypothetical protein
MNDDYDDEDEPGGLWDPDAFTPPPAPARPALHIVTTATADRVDRPVASPNVSEEAERQTLVRLEQFRTASDGPPSLSHDSRLILRAAAAAGALIIAVGAAAFAYGTLGSPDRSALPASTPRAGAVLAVDSEHTAATREVASANSRVRNASQLAPPTTHHTQSKSPSVTATQSRSSPRAQHAPMVSGSHPATSVTSTVVRTAAPTTRHQAQATSATSEFGFEG